MDVQVDKKFSLWTIQLSSQLCYSYAFYHIVTNSSLAPIQCHEISQFIIVRFFDRNSPQQYSNNITSSLLVLYYFLANIYI